MRNHAAEKWYCRACNKAAYGSASRATYAIDTLHFISERDKKPVRAYQCPYGNGYHLTSKEAWA